MKYSKLYMIFFAIIFVGFPVYSQTTVDCPPLADATICTGWGSPLTAYTTNYGGSGAELFEKYLQLGFDRATPAGTSYTWGYPYQLGYCMALIKFDLSSIPAGVTITSAKIKLVRLGLGYSESNYDWIMKCHKVTSTWGEYTVTAATIPSHEFFAQNTYPVIGSGDFYIEIVSLAQGWLDGSIPDYGIILEKGDNAQDLYVYFGAREKGGAFIPRLEVTYEVEKTPTRFRGDHFIDKTTKIGMPILLEAKLEEDTLGYPDIEGKTVHFDIYYNNDFHEIDDDDTDETLFFTDPNGIASVYYTPPKNLPPGDYTIRARYDGNYEYQSCGLTRTLTINKPNWLILYYLTHGKGGGISLDFYSNEYFKTIASKCSYEGNFQAVVLWDHEDNGNQDRVYLMKDENNYNSYIENVDCFLPTDIDLDDLEFNMGDPETFKKFAAWTIDRFLAENYALVFFDHGLGVRPTGDELQPIKGIRTNGFLWDDNNNMYISVSEFGEICRYIRGLLSGPIGVIHLDACLMQMVEIACEINTEPTTCSYLVGSENIGWASDNGYYDKYLSHIDESTSAEDLAVDIATEYHNDISNAHTISVIDMSHMTNVLTSLNLLAQGLKQNMWQIKAELQDARLFMQKFDDNDNIIIEQTDNFVDLKDFAQECHDRISNTEIQNLADNLLTMIGDEGTGLVVYEEHVSNEYWDFSSGTHGQAIFFPHSTFSDYYNYINSPYSDNHSNLLFTETTEWDEFLIGYFDEYGPDCYIVNPNNGGLFSGDILVTATATDTHSDILYVEFQYSLDEANWYSLPGPDSVDGKDWNSDNGWELTFRTVDPPEHDDYRRMLASLYCLESQDSVSFWHAYIQYDHIRF